MHNPVEALFAVEDPMLRARFAIPVDRLVDVTHAHDAVVGMRPAAFVIDDGDARVVELCARLRADAPDGLGRDAGISVGPGRADGQPDAVLHRGGGAGIVNVVGILLREVEHGVEPDAAGIPALFPRAEHRVVFVLMPRERVGLERPRLADEARVPVRRGHARVKHHKACRLLRVGQDARLLHLLRLPGRVRAADDDFPADRLQWNGCAGGEDRGVGGGQQEGGAEDEQG